MCVPPYCAGREWGGGHGGDGGGYGLVVCYGAARYPYVPQYKDQNGTALAKGLKLLGSQFRCGDEALTIRVRCRCMYTAVLKRLSISIQTVLYQGPYAEGQSGAVAYFSAVAYCGAVSYFSAVAYCGALSLLCYSYREYKPRFIRVSESERDSYDRSERVVCYSLASDQMW